MIVIATPTRADISIDTTADIIRACKRQPEMLQFLGLKGIYIATLRQAAVMAARAIDATHVLFVDSDMRFPADAPERLLGHGQDIVAANYVQRTMPEWWCSRVGGQPLSSYHRTGLQPVDSTGCGLMLVKLSVFDDCPLPWFDTPFEGVSHIGEDLYFCRKVRGRGYQILIDHDLSQQVRHQGVVEHGVQAMETEGVTV